MKILKIIGKGGVEIIRLELDVKGKDFSYITDPPIDFPIQAIALMDTDEADRLLGGEMPNEKTR